MRKVFGLILFVFISSVAYAAGFRVALQGTKQQGMGHVGAGLNVGPSNIFFNPGALALQEKGGIELGGSAIFGSNQFNSPGTTITHELEDNVGTPVFLYGSFKLNDRLAGGLGVYTPYGNRVEWPEDWTGQYVSELVDLKSFFIQPTLSYQLTDKLGIGAGLIYALGTVELERGIPAPTPTSNDANLSTDGAASGIGFNAGVFYQPTEELSFGFNYRSKVEVEAEDGIVTTTFPASTNPAITGLFQANRFDATLPLPSEFAFGAGWQVSEKLLLATDFNYITWSQYEELVFNYNGDFGGPGVTTTVIPQNWEDAWTVKIGAEYAANENLALRAGAYRDFTPIPDFTLASITPDADRTALSAGASYQVGENFAVDGSFLYLKGDERTVQASENIANFGQRYDITVAIPSLGFGYSFN